MKLTTYADYPGAIPMVESISDHAIDLQNIADRVAYTVRGEATAAWVWIETDAGERIAEAVAAVPACPDGV